MRQQIQIADRVLLERLTTFPAAVQMSSFIFRTHKSSLIQIQYAHIIPYCNWYKFEQQIRVLILAFVIRMKVPVLMLVKVCSFICIVQQAAVAVGRATRGVVLAYKQIESDQLAVLEIVESDRLSFENSFE